jgi:hypothetical protein
MRGSARPSVWLVCPAWRRFAVTRLALAQRAHLAGVLAARGIDCHTVVVADDENLEIAREHGCATVELDNEQGLGRKFNAGFRYAAEQGADWLVHIGSDDWIHPDVFTPLLAPVVPHPIISGRAIAFVDLLTGQLRQARLDGPTGVIPWVIPRALLEPCHFAPIRPERRSGIDGELVRGLRRAHVTAAWVFHDPHGVARVDFKSDVNINPFASLPFRGPRSDPWAALAEHYPGELVDLAHKTHVELEEDNMPKLIAPDGRTVSVSPKGVESLLADGYRHPGEARQPSDASGDSAALIEDLRAQIATLEADLAAQQESGAAGTARIAELEEAIAEANDDALSAARLAVLHGFSKEALEVEAEKKEITVTGTGANGNVKKDDLVNALAAPAAG